MNNINFTPTNTCYKYDGSFYGMLSCIFESFSKKELPIEITTFDRATLFTVKIIETNENWAKRILDSIPLKINALALENIKLAYLTDYEHKELGVLHFLISGYKYGKNFIQTIRSVPNPEKIFTAGVLDNPHISGMQKAIDLLTLEAHRFVMFVRFSQVNGALVSIIEPQNNILPLLVDHFTQRFRNEQFLIYDKTHSLGLLYLNKKPTIEHIENFEMPDLDEHEKQYQKLWQIFFNSVAIKERINPRCQNNFLPKKYRNNMTEFMNL